jgi:lysophospholipase L1-like esterase
MSEKKDWHNKEFRKFVALGESTTAGGWSTSPERCWVPRLKALIDDMQQRPVELFNAGIGANVISRKAPEYAHSGQPAADTRLDKHVIKERPDLLVISYGLNDARGGTSVAFFCAVMASLIRRVRKKIDPVIVLPGPYFMTDFTVGQPHWSKANLDIFATFNQAIAQVAREEQCLFVDLLAAYGGAEWMIHYDGVHANDLGHRIVANRIFEVLAQHCSGLAAWTREQEQASPRWRDESCLKLGFKDQSVGPGIAGRSR